MSYRKLTNSEKDLARTVYGDLIDYDIVRIYNEKGVLGQGDNEVVTPDGNIYYPSGNAMYSGEFSTGNQGQQSIFIHEMAHVLQHQQGIPVQLRTVSDWLENGAKLNYDYDPIFHGVAFHELTLEQQAEYIQDLFRKRNGWDINPNKIGGDLENPGRELAEYEEQLPMDLPSGRDAGGLVGHTGPDIPLPIPLFPWIPQTTIPHAGSQAVGSPLVIDVDGDGIELAALNGTGAVYWDIDADGFREASGWIAGGDGLLALDRNATKDFGSYPFGPVDRRQESRV